MKLADWIELIEKTVISKNKTCKLGSDNAQPLFRPESGITQYVAVFDNFSNPCAEIKLEDNKEIHEIYQVFHDWCIDYEPDYVPLVDLLIEEIIKIHYVYNSYFTIFYPVHWHISSYFKPKTLNHSNIDNKYLIHLFEMIVNAIKLFKRIYEIR